MSLWNNFIVWFADIVLQTHLIILFAKTPKGRFSSVVYFFNTGKFNSFLAQIGCVELLDPVSLILLYSFNGIVTESSLLSGKTMVWNL